MCCLVTGLRRCSVQSVPPANPPHNVPRTRKTGRRQPKDPSPLKRAWCLIVQTLSAGWTQRSTESPLQRKPSLWRMSSLQALINPHGIPLRGFRNSTKWNHGRVHRGQILFKDRGTTCQRLMAVPESGILNSTDTPLCLLTGWMLARCRACTIELSLAT